MSYILEALRKSERERQKNQAPLIGPTPVDPPSQKARWPVWAVSGLLLLNVLILVLVFGFQSNTPVSENLAHDKQREQNNQLDEIPAKKNGLANKNTEPVNRSAEDPKFDTSPSDPPTRLAQNTKQKPIASRTPPVKSPEPRPNAVQPIRKSTAATRSTPAKIQQRFEPPVTPPIIKKETKTKNPANQGLDTISKQIAANRTLNTPKPLAKQESESVSEVEIAKDNEAENAANDIPVLRNMPPDFQRRVPTLKVNVFAYSENADERFAIVNMVKYREGQAPQDGLIIEEIGPDSMIMQFEGKKFRFGNP